MCSQNEENKHNGLIKSIPMLTFSFFALISAIVAQTLPETKDTPLLQTLTEANQFYESDKKRKFFSK